MDRYWKLFYVVKTVLSECCGVLGPVSSSCILLLNVFSCLFFNPPVLLYNNKNVFCCNRTTVFILCLVLVLQIYFYCIPFYFPVEAFQDCWSISSFVITRIRSNNGTFNVTILFGCTWWAVLSPYSMELETNSANESSRYGIYSREANKISETHRREREREEPSIRFHALPVHTIHKCYNVIKGQSICPY